MEQKPTQEHRHAIRSEFHRKIVDFLCFEFAPGFGTDIIKDFVKGTDKLKFTDASSGVLSNLAYINAADVGSDMVISVISDKLTLEGLAGTTFDITFLELV